MAFSSVKTLQRGELSGNMAKVECMAAGEVAQVLTRRSQGGNYTGTAPESHVG